MDFHYRVIKFFLLHPYTEKPGDVILKQFHSNGTLHLYTVLKNERSANGWSHKIFCENKCLKQEENYSNGLLIEVIKYDESSVITAHKIWSNRLKQLIDKPAHPKLTRPNVVVGYAFLSAYLEQLPAVSEFIHAYYDRDSLLRSFHADYKREAHGATWTMRGEQMSFSIYWNHDEVSHQWHCHCAKEELYWKARVFLEGRL